MARPSADRKTPGYLALALLLGAATLAWYSEAPADGGSLRFDPSESPDSGAIPPPKPAFLAQLPALGSAAISFSLIAPADSDLEQTYGAIRTLGLRIGFQWGEMTELLLGIAGGKDSGNPYYGTDDFESRERARLTIFPIEIGLRRIHQGSGDKVFNLGWACACTWMSESNTALQGNLDSPAGWRTGVRLFAGPEWRFSEEQRALGLELSLGLQSFLDRSRGQDADPGSVKSYFCSLSLYLANIY